MVQFAPANNLGIPDQFVEGGGDPDAQKIKGCAYEPYDQNELEDMREHNPAGCHSQLRKGENKLEMVVVPADLENPVIHAISCVFANDHPFPAGIPCRQIMKVRTGDRFQHGRIAALTGAVLRASQLPKKKGFPAGHPVQILCDPGEFGMIIYYIAGYYLPSLHVARNKPFFSQGKLFFGVKIHGATCY
jgi:hypothetical protein